MDGRQVIAAGIGCRRHCPPDAIVALVHRAARTHRIDALAAPAFKRDEPGLHQAALALALPLHFIEHPALAAVQPLCPTRSGTARSATGLASVAEAAALALAGPPLLVPRFGAGEATCAVAGR